MILIALFGFLFLWNFQTLKPLFEDKPSYENGSTSPDRSGNPFCGGVHHKKIEADSGKLLLKI
ncbi:hypothetical protein HYN56_02450 [Flavobacterium crocinum]|uniref:Uncharacterized protein n=1 Tax=Flavobacterium crocinum TaxID=2183896 RepID=A0A2S1YGG0_9FLAO|nr:hypothetical protein HYN56_02450 [Flavobacterium crocinum]